MRTSRTARFGVVISLALASISGCAWLSPRSTGTRIETPRTWQETKSSRERGSRAIDARVTGSGNAVVNVYRPVQCVSKTVTFKETQKVDEYKVPWSAAGSLLIGSVLGVALGGYFTGTAFGRPDLDDPYSRDELSKEGSLGIGLPLVVAGLAAGGMALWSILTAHDRPRSPWVSEDVTDEARSECGQEAVAGVNVVLNTWDHRRAMGTTNADGLAIFKIDPTYFVLPPTGRTWATVKVDEVQPKQLTPPASAFVAAVAASNSLEQFKRFRERFPAATGWKDLEPSYRKILAQEEEERQRREEERQRKLEEERLAAEQAQKARREEWRKATKSALAEARRLGKRGRWDGAYSVLSNVDELEGDPLGEKVKAARRTALKSAVRQRLKQRPQGRITKWYEDPYDILITELRSYLNLLAEWGEDRLIRKIEARIEELELARHVVAKGRFWVLTDGGTLLINTPSNKGAATALVRGLKAYLSTDFAKTIKAWVGCGPKCGWRIKVLGTKVDFAGTTLRVKLRITLVDSFGERRAGHDNYSNSFVDLDRVGGRWTLDLNAFTVFTSMGL